MLKQYKDKLTITNPGQFIGGITPQNILHHPSVTRNIHLMDLLDKLKFVNRSNLGVPRIYRSLLIEGKEPPIYREVGNHIELTFISSSINSNFKGFISHLSDEGVYLDTDHLIVLQYLLRHNEIDTTTASDIMQRNQEQAREILSNLANDMGLLESVGYGKGRHYTLSKLTSDQLKGKMQYERHTHLDSEAIKIRVLSILKNQALSNKELRQLTGFDQKQVQRLMTSLKEDGVVRIGRGAGTKYALNEKNSEE